MTPEDADAGVLARLAVVLAAQPTAVALVDDEQTLSFADVAALAAHTARAVAALQLRRWHPGADDEDVDPVAVLAGHRAATVAAVVGVLAGGAPLVVLDHALPHPRLLQYLRRSGARAVLCDPEHAARARALAADAGQPLAVLDVPTDPGTVTTDAPPAFLPPDLPAPDVRAPAALVFTSGTTGQPKGVVYDHRLFPRSAYNVSLRDGTYDADDVLASVLPLGFSAGLDHTLAGLQVGARQQLRDLRQVRPGEMVDWLGRSGVTVLNTSPSMARALVTQVPEGGTLAGLRSVTLTSEAVHRSDVRALRRVLPAGCALSNRWGASETGLATVLPLAPEDDEGTGQLPVGWPVAGLELAVEPDDAPPGTEPAEPTGTMTVTGRYLARRYWRDPEKTAQAFTELPDGRRRLRTSDVGRLDDTGCFSLVGRRDHSVKIRGYLVEPGEVEAALFALPDVQESVVVGVAGPGRTRLVGYVVSTSERPAAAGLRSRLRDVLPPWMVPETVVFLDRLPRTERGKVDRGALPPAPPLVPGGTPPRTDWETVVAELWAHVLQLPEVGVHDDFFELGGDSLAAEELLSTVVDDLRVPAGQVDSAALLASSTVAEFAARLRRPPDVRDPVLVPLRPEGVGTPLFCLAGGGGIALGFVPLVRHLDDALPVWGLQAHGLEHRGLPDWSVPATARRYVRAMRRVRPRGPYRLFGHSFGAVVALEVARRLTAAGELVELLVVVDAVPPGVRAVRPGRSVPRRLRDLAGLAATGIVPTPGRGQYWRYHSQAQVLSARYRPAPWTGRSLVLVTDGPEREMRSAWAQFLHGERTAATIPGDHHSLLREPHVRALAAQVSAALDGRPPG